ncbi:MAG: hypothetical protein M0C28_47720 [Candidatus Moduliflexus flocculans]|nr:hypothetical protein [Candidatus Moduliflexus flocculans]
MAVCSGRPRGNVGGRRGPPSPSQDEARIQPVSWDGSAAKTKAEKNDAEGTSSPPSSTTSSTSGRPGGWNSPVRGAWGLNNAAYMIIKMHRQDLTVDLEPARKLLEEGLALAEAPEDCRKVLVD